MTYSSWKISLRKRYQNSQINALQIYALFVISNHLITFILSLVNEISKVTDPRNQILGTIRGHRINQSRDER